MPEDLETRRRRARWRAHHRGTKELDLLIGRYADMHLATMGEPQLTIFEDLLVQQEPVLQRWLLDAELPDDVAPQIRDVVLAIRVLHGLDQDDTQGVG